MSVFNEKISGGSKFFDVTPQDNTKLDVIPRALYIGSEGDLTVTDADGDTVTFVAVPAGTILPVMPVTVESTNTTASNIVGIV